MKKVAISQSNYIPWKGYFDNIAAVDTFVLFDNAQYTRRDWRNRNIIKTSQGDKWLTIPVEVKGKYFQSIRDTKIADFNWADKHLKALTQSYSKAPFYGEVKDWVEHLYQSSRFKFLSEINYHFLTAINQYLGISTEIRWSDEFKLLDGQNEKLISICKELGASSYYSPPAAKSYMDELKFKKEGIDVSWSDYSGYKEYPQLYGDFNHFVTIFDLIFNLGTKASDYLKFNSNE